MILRLLGYMVRVWKRFLAEKPECDLLPVIVPMVLFHGPRGWRGPVSFHALVDVPDESFLPYIPDFRCKLFDLSPFGQDELAGNAIVRILGDLLGAFGRSDFEDRLRRALETLNELKTAPSFARFLEILFRYILQVFDMEQEELGNLVTQTLKPDVKEFLMTTYEQLVQKGEQIGLQKGEQIGLQKGASRVLIRLLSKRFPGEIDHLMPLLIQLSPEQQDELGERILDAGSLEEIVQWLEAARQN